LVLFRVGQGTPICDSWEVRVLGENGESCFALADGCGWGEKKRIAAHKASGGLVRSVGEQLPSCKNTAEVAGVLQKGLRAAHEAIVAGQEDVWDSGTCSLGGGETKEKKKQKKKKEKRKKLRGVCRGGGKGRRGGVCVLCGGGGICTYFHSEQPRDGAGAD
jgi:hypothetical protein